MFAQTARNYGNFHNQLVLETGRNAKMKKTYLLLCFSFVAETKGMERKEKENVMKYVKMCKYV